MHKPDSVETQDLFSGFVRSILSDFLRTGIVLHRRFEAFISNNYLLVYPFVFQGVSLRRLLCRGEGRTSSYTEMHEKAPTRQSEGC